MAMRIYVACLASYNAGILHGRWIDADSSVDVMQEQVDAMLRESPEPNVMRAEYENETGEKHISSGTNGEFEPSYVSASGETWTLIGKPFASAEEFAIHDFEGLPTSFGEYCGLQTIADYVALCEEFDHIDESVMAAIYGDFSSVDEMRSALDDNFVGIYDAFRDYADECADEMINCREPGENDILARYFDYAAWARDLKMDMRVIDLDNGRVAIFHA